MYIRLQFIVVIKPPVVEAQTFPLVIMSGGSAHTKTQRFDGKHRRILKKNTRANSIYSRCAWGWGEQRRSLDREGARAKRIRYYGIFYVNVVVFIVFSDVFFAGVCVCVCHR